VIACDSALGLLSLRQLGQHTYLYWGSPEISWVPSEIAFAIAMGSEYSPSEYSALGSSAARQLCDCRNLLGMVPFPSAGPCVTVTCCFLTLTESCQLTLSSDRRFAYLSLLSHMWSDSDNGSFPLPPTRWEITFECAMNTAAESRLKGRPSRLRTCGGC
jgi:hypothetical protein